MDKRLPGEELLETRHRDVHFGRRDVQPATTLYIALEDRLRVLIFNSAAAVEVDVEARIQLADGQVIPYRSAFFPTSARAQNSFEQDLAEGFLLDVSVSTPSAAVRTGGTYVVAQIIRGTGANAIVMRSLLANYIVTGMSIGWPEGPNQGSVQGNGLVRSVQVGNPAAGADWTATVPTGARWLVQSLSAFFQASATVASRTARLEIKDGGGNQLWGTATTNAVTASSSATFNAASGVNVQSLLDQPSLVIPDPALMLQGFTIGTVTNNIQAGDQWSAISLCVVEWIEQ